MRNPTHSAPPCLLGPGGDYAHAYWPFVDGQWRSFSTFWFLFVSFWILVFFAMAFGAEAVQR